MSGFYTYLSIGGLTGGPDGATHQMLEDIALMRALPNMVVISPCDAEEGRKATLAAAALGKPAYLRFTREKSPVMTTVETPFAIGKANVLWKSDFHRNKDEKETGVSTVAIIATGPLVYNALLAVRELEKEGVAATVVNVHTIKPLDEETIVREARAAGAVVTVEEHQIAGGLGGAVAELLARTSPLPIEFVGVRDRFGQSGTSTELYEEYGMTPHHIQEAARKAIARKG
mgnify:FL=1